MLISTGKLNLKGLLFQPIHENTTTSLESLTEGKEFVLVLLDPDKEPSKHILNDLSTYTNSLNQWNGKFVFIMSKENEQLAQVLTTYLLPEKRYVGIDVSDNILHAISTIYKQDFKDNMPLILLSDETGNIYYFSSGYKIGIGEQLLRIKASMATIINNTQSK